MAYAIWLEDDNGHCLPTAIAEHSALQISWRESHDENLPFSQLWRPVCKYGARSQCTFGLRGQPHPHEYLLWSHNCSRSQTVQAQCNETTCNFEARSVNATLKIAMYEAAKLPRSSMWKICQINSRSVSSFWSNAREYTTSNVLKSAFPDLQRERKMLSTIDLVQCKITKCG